MKRSRLKRTPLRKVNRTREKKRFRKQYHSEKRKQAVIGMPCSIPGCRNWPSENHHRIPKSRGGTYLEVFPLCKMHHTGGSDSWHALGSEELFDTAHRFDSQEACRETEMRCQELGVYSQELSR